MRVILVHPTVIVKRKPLPSFGKLQTWEIARQVKISESGWERVRKLFWTQRASGLLHWCKKGLHRCKRGFGWCKRLLGDLCSLGPEESKRPLAPSPNHFWRYSLFGLFPRSALLSFSLSLSSPTLLSQF